MGALTDPTQASRLTEAASAGDERAGQRLFEIVYRDLHALAASLRRGEGPGLTHQTSDLVHEVYLRLVGDHDRTWNGRDHFFAVAAEAIRRILVEQARRRATLRRGGGRKRSLLADHDDVAPPVDLPALLALDEALDRLEEEDPVKATLVKLRYFGGMTIPQAAEVAGVSHATAERYWAYSRARLYQWINGQHARPRPRSKSETE